MSTLNIDNIADVAGTGAPDFAAMPTVAGDLVVESGSNTDGNWTRWADGTLLASGYLSGVAATADSGAFGSTAGTMYRYGPASKPFPVPFYTTDPLRVSGVGYNNVTRTAQIDGSSLTTTNFTGSLFTASSGASVAATFTFHGRWK